MRRVFAIGLLGCFASVSLHAGAVEMADEVRAARMADTLEAIDQTCTEVRTLQAEVRALEAQEAERIEKRENEGLRSDDTALSKEALIESITQDFIGLWLPSKKRELAARRKLLDLRSANFVRLFGEEGEAILQDRCIG